MEKLQNFRPVSDRMRPLPFSRKGSRTSAVCCYQRRCLNSIADQLLTTAGLIEVMPEKRGIYHDGEKSVSVAAARMQPVGRY
jgi:hypothetical protein